MNKNVQNYNVNYLKDKMHNRVKINDEKHDILKIISNDYYHTIDNLAILSFKNYFAMIVTSTQNNIENILSSNFVLVNP